MSIKHRGVAGHSSLEIREKSRLEIHIWEHQTVPHSVMVKARRRDEPTWAVRIEGPSWLPGDLPTLPGEGDKSPGKEPEKKAGRAMSAVS